MRAMVKLEVADHGLDGGPPGVAFVLLFPLVVAVGLSDLAGQEHIGLDDTFLASVAPVHQHALEVFFGVDLCQGKGTLCFFRNCHSC